MTAALAPPKRSIVRLILTAFVVILIFADIAVAFEVRIFDDFGARLPMLTMIVLKCRILLLTINSLISLSACYFCFWKDRRLSYSSLGLFAAVGLAQAGILACAIYVGIFYSKDGISSEP